MYIHPLTTEDPHKIVVDEESQTVHVLSCQTGQTLSSCGGCEEGCCTDHICPDCGKKFRVEWPD